MTVEITPKIVKQLRDQTGAGMMDCKRTLEETNGDMEKAINRLRQKGLLVADKKATRQTTQGVIECYIHTGGQLGVLVELNCETDFAARDKEFQKLAKDIAMQIAAYPNVEYIAVTDVPQTVIQKEWEIEAGKADIVNKPTEVKNKIIDGRVQKLIKNKILLEQPFIKNSSITVEELLKENIAKLRENIKIARFTRFQVGT